MKKNRIPIQKDTVIRDRYKILNRIGQGGIGTTYRAHDETTDKAVALKVLDMEKIENMKELELFEREVNVLKNIDNPLIPNYIEHFQINMSKHPLYILVQEFVDGDNLYNLVKNGKNYTEKNILNILKSILNTLSYIHNLHPPIIHRDINPKNIILHKNNKIYIVDFGAVGRGHKDTLTGAKSDTFVGTIGYMPQEQLFGKVHPGLDIYALGVTALFLLSGKEPWEFSIKNMKIDFHKSVKISEDLRYLIDKMINPDDKKRLSTAKKALSLLNEIESLIVEKPVKPVEAIDNTNEQIETGWVKEALNEQNKRKTKTKSEKSKKEYKSKVKENKEKRNKRKKIEKDRKQAAKAPLRAKIIKHSDGVELLIEPYPVLRLFLKIISEYYAYWITILVFTTPFWLIFIDVGPELFAGMDFNEATVIILSLLIAPAFFLLFFIISIFYLTIRDHSKDSALHIRISNDNYCAIYKKNPKKSIYIDNKNKITFSAITSSYNRPYGRGKKSEFWGGIQINIHKLKEPLKRTGLTHKDLEVINEFKALYFRSD